MSAPFPRGNFEGAFGRRSGRCGMRGDFRRGRRVCKISLERVSRKAVAQGRAHRRQGMHSGHRRIRAFGTLAEQRHRHTFPLRGRRRRRNKGAPCGRSNVSALGYRREARAHERDRERNSRARRRRRAFEKLAARRPFLMRRRSAVFALPAHVRRRVPALQKGAFRHSHALKARPPRRVQLDAVHTGAQHKKRNRRPARLSDDALEGAAELRLAEDRGSHAAGAALRRRVQSLAPRVRLFA